MEGPVTIPSPIVRSSVLGFSVHSFSFEKQYLNVSTDKWKAELSREGARRGYGQNKLRTYRTFKSTFETENLIM